MVKDMSIKDLLIGGPALWVIVCIPVILASAVGIGAGTNLLVLIVGFLFLMGIVWCCSGEARKRELLGEKSGKYCNIINIYIYYL